MSDYAFVNNETVQILKVFLKHLVYNLQKTSSNVIDLKQRISSEYFDVKKFAKLSSEKVRHCQIKFAWLFSLTRFSPSIGRDFFRAKIVL